MDDKAIIAPIAPVSKPVECYLNSFRGDYAQRIFANATEAARLLELKYPTAAADIEKACQGEMPQSQVGSLKWRWANEAVTANESGNPTTLEYLIGLRKSNTTTSTSNINANKIVSLIPPKDARLSSSIASSSSSSSSSLPSPSPFAVVSPRYPNSSSSSATSSTRLPEAVNNTDNSSNSNNANIVSSGHIKYSSNKDATRNEGNNNESSKNSSPGSKKRNENDTASDSDNDSNKKRIRAAITAVVSSSSADTTTVYSIPKNPKHKQSTNYQVRNIATTIRKTKTNKSNNNNSSSNSASTSRINSSSIHVDIFDTTTVVFPHMSKNERNKLLNKPVKVYEKKSTATNNKNEDSDEDNVNFDRGHFITDCNSVKDASLLTGTKVKMNKILQNCLNEIPFAGDYVFQFEDDYYQSIVQQQHHHSQVAAAHSNNFNNNYNYKKLAITNRNNSSSEQKTNGNRDGVEDDSDNDDVWYTGIINKSISINSNDNNNNNNKLPSEASSSSSLSKQQRKQPTPQHQQQNKPPISQLNANQIKLEELREKSSNVKSQSQNNSPRRNESSRIAKTFTASAALINNTSKMTSSSSTKSSSPRVSDDKNLFNDDSAKGNNNNVQQQQQSSKQKTQLGQTNSSSQNHNQNKSQQPPPKQLPSTTTASLLGIESLDCIDPATGIVWDRFDRPKAAAFKFYNYISKLMILSAQAVSTTNSITSNQNINSNSSNKSDQNGSVIRGLRSSLKMGDIENDIRENCESGNRSSKWFNKLAFRWSKDDEFAVAYNANRAQQEECLQSYLKDLLIQIQRLEESSSQQQQMSQKQQPSSSPLLMPDGCSTFTESSVLSLTSLAQENNATHIMTKSNTLANSANSNFNTNIVATNNNHNNNHNNINQNAVNNQHVLPELSRSYSSGTTSSGLTQTSSSMINNPSTHILSSSANANTALGAGGGAAVAGGGVIEMKPIKNNVISESDTISIATADSGVSKSELLKEYKRLIVEEEQLRILLQQNAIQQENIQKLLQK